MRLFISCLGAVFICLPARIRGYESVLVATALFATLGITGFAAPSGGDDAHITVGPIGILGIPEETAQLVASLKDPEERRGLHYLLLAERYTGKFWLASEGD